MAGRKRSATEWSGPVVPMSSGELIPIDGFGSKVIQLDPRTAALWLDAMPRNRKLKTGQVEFLARQIEDGKFEMTGQGAIFDREGHLLDGQHRCHAVIQTGTAVPINVVWGVDPDAQDKMDQGVVRGFDGALQMDGVPYAKEIASGARLIYSFEQRGVVNGAGIGRVAIPELREVVERHPLLYDGGRVAASTNGHGLRYPRAVSCALYTLFAEVDQEDAEAFFEKLASGAGLEEGDPIFALRRVIIQEMSKQYHFDNLVLSALTIKAWNKWREGGKIHSLRWRQGGAAPESYPDIDGFDYDSLTRL